MRHATRLALVLVLLGMTALFQAENARSESIESSCTVSRNCDYGSPISCTSPTGECHSGPESYGWVECDGSRQYCPPCTYTSGNGICECPEDPDCCPYPDCNTLSGSCKRSAQCSIPTSSGCRTFTCNCFEGELICP